MGTGTSIMNSAQGFVIGRGQRVFKKHVMSIDSHSRVEACYTFGQGG